MHLRTKTYDLCCGVRCVNGRHKLYCPLSIALGTQEVGFDSELESELEGFGGASVWMQNRTRMPS
jgi:hypothetical protein